MAIFSREKRPRARLLADIALRQLDPLVAKRGFGQTSVVTAWPEIVGARIAEICEPAQIKWPPRPRGRPDGKDERATEPATLILRVEPGFGLEAQHLAPTIIDRVNAHLGWRCVSRVLLRQEPLGAVRAAPKSRALPQDMAARARAEAATAGVAGDALRASLARLGENALAAKARRGFKAGD